MTSGAGANGSSEAVRMAERNDARLAAAALILARAEREIDYLWGESVAVDDADVSDSLAELSHSLHRAARLLERRDHAIG